MYWGFLVAVGFLACFVGIKDPNLSTGYVTNYSNLTEIQCTPPNGFLNTSAGQVNGWSSFYITREFIDENHCVEPCSTCVDPYFGKTLFRSNQDMRALTMREVDRSIEQVGITSRDASAIGLTYFYFQFALMALPYIIAQGLWAVLFGRKTPAQARHKFYAVLTSVRLRRREGIPAGAWQVNVATCISLLAYLWALFILVLCSPLFIFNLVAGEIFLRPFPQSEDQQHIGAWGPWASTVLVLIAAIIAKYHNVFADLLIDCINDVFWFVGYTWFRLNQWMGDNFFTWGSDPYIMGVQDAKAPVRHDRRYSRKSSIMPAPGIVAEAGCLVKNVLLDIGDSIRWWFRNAWQVLMHEWNVFARGWTNPDESPQTRRRVPKPHRRVVYAEEEEDAAYGPVPGHDLDEKNKVDVTTTQTEDPDSIPGKRLGTRHRVQLGLLPGGQRAQRLINNIGLHDHIDIGGTPDSRALSTLPTHHSAAPELVDLNWTRLSSPLPPVPKNGSIIPTPTPINPSKPMKKARGLTRTVTWEEDQSRRPRSAGSIMEISRTSSIAGRRQSEEVLATMGLTSSFTEPIEERRRRSQHYSPDISPHATGPFPYRSPLLPASDPTTPNADPSEQLIHSTNTASNTASDPPRVYQTESQTPSSTPNKESVSADNADPDNDPSLLPIELHPSSLPELTPPVLDADHVPDDPLLSPEELQRLLMRSTSPSLRLPSSRSSGLVEGSGGNGNGDGNANAGRSSVSYLQVERPATMFFEDEVVLRKDRWGRYHVVKNRGGERERKEEEEGAEVRSAC